MSIPFWQLTDELNRQFDAKLPFVVYRKAGENQIKALLMDNTKSDEFDYEKEGFLLQSFDSKVHFFFNKMTAKSLTSEIELERTTLEYDYAIKEEPDAIYQESFGKIKEFITSGAIDKVVLSRIAEIEIKTFNLEKLIVSLFRNFSSAFCSCFYHPQYNFWIGATPESLLRVRSGRLEIMSLAGTKKMDSQKTWTSKEDEEQYLVTQYIKDCLEKMNFEDVEVENSNRQAENVVHKLTMISADCSSMENQQLKQLIESLHPTPAVCGVPKEEAFKAIVKSEQHDRLFYSGFLGEINVRNEHSHSRETDLYVHLRCANWDENLARIYIGGGITALSNLHHEWRETEYKSFAMKKLIEMTERKASVNE